jgi:protein O-mannosyl-transferase
MRSRWIWAAIALLALLPHLGGLRNSFVFDDRGVIVNNPAVTGFDLRSIWTRPYWPTLSGANLYRPLTSTTFAVDWKIGGGSSGAFVATNLLIHAAATLAALALMRRLFPKRPGVGLATVAIFAVHPLHVEAVVGIVGRSELLAALFTLLGYRVWLDAERDGSNRGRLAAAGLWLLALLSKESAVTLPLLLIAHRTGFLPSGSQTRRIRAADLAWPIALIVALSMRASALHGLAGPRPSRIDNPLAFVSSLARMLGAGGVFLRQCLQFLTGQGLSADYSYAQVDPGAPLYAAGVVGLLALAAAGVWASTRGRKTLEGWGVLFFLAFWTLTSNILIAVGTVQADRLLYLPLLGLLAVVASLGARASARLRSRRAAVVALCACLVFYGIVSARRTDDWRTDRTLFESALRVAPRSIKVRSNLSALILNQKDPTAAPRVLSLLEPVEEEARGFGPFLHWQGKAYLFMGDLDRARSTLRAALAANSDSAETLVELGNLAIEEENGAEALACFDAVARTGRLAEHVAIGRASSFALLGRYGEAADAWIPIVASLPDSVPVRTACAWNLVEAGRSAEAAAVVREGIARRSDPRLWTSLARALIAGAGSRQEALEALERGDGSDPELADAIRKPAGTKLP